MEKLTAIHEAAHVVTAYLSKYHFLLGQITLSSDTNGETFVSLSSKKINKEAKEATQSILQDPEIIEDVAVIYFAGLEAEKIYCEKNSSTVDSSFSMNDHNFVDNLIANANTPLTKTKDNLITITQELVRNNWATIDTISEAILKATNKSLDAVDAIEILDRAYNKNSWA